MSNNEASEGPRIGYNAILAGAVGVTTRHRPLIDGSYTLSSTAQEDLRRRACEFLSSDESGGSKICYIQGGPVDGTLPLSMPSRPPDGSSVSVSRGDHRARGLLRQERAAMQYDPRTHGIGPVSSPQVMDESQELGSLDLLKQSDASEPWLAQQCKNVAMPEMLPYFGTGIS